MQFSRQLTSSLLGSFLLTMCFSAVNGTTLSNITPTVYTGSGTVTKVSGGWKITNGASGSSAITFDYQQAVGGMPFITTSSVTSTSASVSIELLYSETSAGLNKTLGDGPFFLFSNAMDSYRVTPLVLTPSTKSATISPPFAQRSQRYQKVILYTPNSSITISSIGYTPIRAVNPTVNTFSCSDASLNTIWNKGVTTVDKVTVAAGETAVAWTVLANGTRVLGQHWAPVRQGTYWADMVASFDVNIEKGGASWGVHMVANGLIFVLDPATQTLAAFSGFSDKTAVFPTTDLGNFTIPSNITLSGWVSVNTTCSGTSASVTINDVLVAELSDLDIVPQLGESADNTGSVAFGGPQGYSAVYRLLLVTDLSGATLYTNTLQTADKARTLADFGTGSNVNAGTVDGAKRDRAVFGGDLYVLGKAIAYSTNQLSAVLGSITLLTSHQKSNGYLGNLSPIQAPPQAATETFEPPTTSFYSVSYSLALTVAIKDYYMNSGDSATVKSVFPKLVKNVAYIESYVDSTSGLVVASIPEALDFFPGGGPVFGASGKINLAYYDALISMANMSSAAGVTDTFTARAATLKAAILAGLYNADAGILPLSNYVESTGVAQDVNAYGVVTGVVPVNNFTLSLLSAPADGSLPVAWTGISTWEFPLVSPYATGFAVEGLFVRNYGPAALTLIKRVWGIFSNTASADYSGGHWEAVGTDGTPFGYDTSLHHGWSTAPVYLLPKYLAGLAPLTAGWKRFLVAPVLAGLTSVNTCLTTPAGTIAVALTLQENSGTGQVTLTVPTGATAELHAPTGWRIFTAGFPQVLNVTGSNKNQVFAIYKSPY